MIIWAENDFGYFPKRIAELMFLHQNRRTIRRLLHGETMSIAALHSGEYPAWFVRLRSQAFVGPRETQPLFDIHVPQVRLTGSVPPSLIAP